MCHPVAGVLLAAGAGRRYGGAKLLHPLVDGTPMAVAAARALGAACVDALAVVRPGEEALAERLRAAGLAVVVNPRAASGMGASLACGVAERAEAAGWVIALADMPFIRAETIRGVVAALASGARIAAPYHRGRRGHPVGFGRALGPWLTRLDGDLGAREVLRRLSHWVQPVEVDDPGILIDIDTPHRIPASAPDSR